MGVVQVPVGAIGVGDEPGMKPPKRKLESAKGKPLRWRVEAAKSGDLLAIFVFEQHAKNWAVGKRGRVVEVK